MHVHVLCLLNVAVPPKLSLTCQTHSGQTHSEGRRESGQLCQGSVPPALAEPMEME